MEDVFSDSQNLSRDLKFFSNNSKLSKQVEQIFLCRERTFFLEAKAVLPKNLKYVKEPFFLTKGIKVLWMFLGAYVGFKILKWAHLFSKTLLLYFREEFKKFVTMSS